MDDIAGWIAPAATMIAAMMTAANLGARFTGWGFVVFVVGSIAWTIVGASSGQTNLVASNAFLTVVNLVGIWRWLGRQASYDDAAQAVEQRAEPLFAGSSLVGMAVIGRTGEGCAHVVEPMVDCATGRIDHLIVRTGGAAGIGERLHLLPWKQVRMRAGGLSTDADIDALPAPPAKP